MGSRFCVSWLGFVVLTAVVAVRTYAQQPAQPPIFRATVEVTSVDVSVFDDRGRPITDLTPGDFVVRVEGTPRRVVSAQFVPLDTTVAPGVPAKPAPEGFSNNDATTAGRLILIVIDQPNIRFGGTAAIQRSLNAFIDRLQPSDRLAIAGIGPNAAATPFTNDRERLKRALLQMTGLYRPSPIHLHHVGLSEALEILSGNSTTLQTVAIRECLPAVASPSPFASGAGVPPQILTADPDFENCRFEVEHEARDIARESTVDGRQTIAILRELLTALRVIDTPKTMIVVSEGFVMDDRQPEVMELGAIATAARTSIYALKLDDTMLTTLAADNGRPVTSVIRFTDRQARWAGLELLADSARGAVMTVTGNGQGIIERIQSELGGYYLLGVESVPTDKDGKAHGLRVEVNRKGVTVRSRRAVIAPPPMATPATPREAVMAALLTPLPVNGLPLRVTAYSLQGPEPGKVQLLVHADIGTDYSSSKIVTLGFTFSDLDGKVIDSQSGTARVPPIMSGVPSPLQFTAGASLPPGDYLLKLAIVEGDRTGTVEHLFHAGVSTAGPRAFSDLIVGGPLNLNLELQQPTAGYTVAFGGVHGYIEAYGTDAASLKARYEVAPAPTEPAILSEEVTPISAGGGSRAIFTRVMRVRQLPPGKYVMRAIVESPTEPPKTFTRPFEVAAPAVLMTSATGGSGDARLSEVYLPVSDLMLSRPFDRQAAMQSSVLRTFREHVPQPLQSPFDDGVQLLRDGSYAPAEKAFKSAVTPEGDSTAALAYLAATFAASGHDLEAASAWQTSLVDGAEIPQIYEWLAGAALRTHDMAQAKATLEEAVGKWPSDTRFARPMAIVYAAFGQAPEAIRTLERHLDDHPDDLEMLMAAVEWIYQVRLAGAAVHSRPADTQLARKYADVYIKAKGPQVALIRQWMDYLEGGRK